MSRLVLFVAMAFAATLALARPTAAQICTASATPLTFGTYDPFASGPSDITASGAGACRAVTPVAVAYANQLDGGAGGVANRRLSSGVGTLNYQLYVDAARSQVWGDGGAGSVTVNDAYGLAALATANRSYTVYGRIQARQMVAPGAYTDVVTVLVAY